MDPSDPSDKRVFRRTKSYPMEKKLCHGKQLGFLFNSGRVQAACLVIVATSYIKVRLSDGADGSIGQACFSSDKELSDGGKMTS